MRKLLLAALLALVAGSSSAQVLTTPPSDGSFVGGTITSPILFPSGTASAPSIAWSADADGSGTGLYRSSANLVDISINGVRTFAFGASSFTTVNSASVVVTGTGVFQAPNGTRALPAYQFANEPDSGWYVVGTGEIGFSVNDTLAYSFAQAGAGQRWYVSNTERMRLNGTVFLNLDPAYQVTWGSALGSADVGLTRQASNNAVRVTDGSTGYGALVVKDGSPSAVGYGFQTSVGNTGLYYDTTAADAFGFSKQSLTRMLITGDRTLTDATATTIFQIAIADANQVSLQVDYSVQASNATPDYSIITGTFYVGIVNKSGTETCSTITEGGETSVGTGGSTITFTATCDTTPSNAVNIQVNSDSSLSTPTIIGQFIIRRSGTGGTITIS